MGRNNKRGNTGNISNRSVGRMKQRKERTESNKPLDNIKLARGIELRRPDWSDKTGEFQRFDFYKDGQLIGNMNFGMINKTTAEISDVSFSAAARGQRLMSTAFPAIQKELKKQGATNIRLTTVTDAVGTKVWQPLGFKLEHAGDNNVKYWRKTL